jgi:nucleoside phosphorylase
VVADPSWDYQSGKVLKGEFEVAPHQLPLVSALRRRFSEFGQRGLLGAVKDKWAGPKPNSEILLHIGPFASGSAVLADKKRLSAVKQQHRNLLAIDMEAYGLYAAAAEAPMPAPYAVAIKGVSDFGDESKGDEFREYASYVSASVFSYFVANDYFDVRKLLWPA